jgi:hypothetical protein
MLNMRLGIADALETLTVRRELLYLFHGLVYFLSLKNFSTSGQTISGRSANV